MERRLLGVLLLGYVSSGKQGLDGTFLVKPIVVARLVNLDRGIRWMLVDDSQSFMLFGSHIRGSTQRLERSYYLR